MTATITFSSTQMKNTRLTPTILLKAAAILPKYQKLQEDHSELQRILKQYQQDLEPRMTKRSNNQPTKAQLIQALEQERKDSASKDKEIARLKAQASLKDQETARAIQYHSALHPTQSSPVGDTFSRTGTRRQSSAFPDSVLSQTSVVNASQARSKASTAVTRKQSAGPISVTSQKPLTSEDAALVARRAPSTKFHLVADQRVYLDYHEVQGQRIYDMNGFRNLGVFSIEDRNAILAVEKKNDERLIKAKQLVQDVADDSTSTEVDDDEQREAPTDQAPQDSLEEYTDDSVDQQIHGFLDTVSETPPKSRIVTLRYGQQPIMNQARKIRPVKTTIGRSLDNDKRQKGLRSSETISFARSSPRAQEGSDGLQGNRKPLPPKRPSPLRHHKVVPSIENVEARFEQQCTGTQQANQRKSRRLRGDEPEADYEGQTSPAVTLSTTTTCKKAPATIGKVSGAAPNKENVDPGVHALRERTNKRTQAGSVAPVKPRKRQKITTDTII
ncbi:Hypothetical protein D9617_29g007040 [Elsinoe fawcettii]|nr:Hypothetical protein D9617_29g007040 [Elsinoe fawcettii]